MSGPVVVVRPMSRPVRIFAVVTVEMTAILVLVMVFVPMFSRTPLLIMDVSVRTPTVHSGVVPLVILRLLVCRVSLMV
ncbi:MAG: hypothetical protein AB1Y26_06540 [Cycloclasticus sp.]